MVSKKLDQNCMVCKEVLKIDSTLEKSYYCTLLGKIVLKEVLVDTVDDTGVWDVHGIFKKYLDNEFECSQFKA